MPKPYLVSLLGHSGSGKSYFARALAAQHGFVRFNGDSLRIAMYGSVEEMHRVRDIDTSLVREKIFNALDYATSQVLDAGVSVVYDANNNKRSIRTHQRDLAKAHGAINVVAWIQTTKELALERVKSRDELIDQRKMTEEQANETVGRHIDQFEEPTPEELVIAIDGTLSSEEQLNYFMTQLGVLGNE